MRRLFLNDTALAIVAAVVTVAGIVTTAVAVHYGFGEMEG